jgi:NifU-like protein involved in Fe-S cluster formation
MYGETATNHFPHPRNIGPLECPDAVGTAGTPGEGNFMVVEMRVDDGTIRCARFQTYGCPGAVASGSCLTEWVTGMAASAAAAITPEQLEQRLGGLPLGKGHCAALAVEAMRRALAQITQEWKRTPPQGTGDRCCEVDDGTDC